MDHNSLNYSIVIHLGIGCPRFTYETLYCTASQDFHPIDEETTPKIKGKET